MAQYRVTQIVEYPYVDDRDYRPNPYQPPPQPIIIHRQQMPGSFCPVCSAVTDSYVKKGVGGITWIWCIFLFFFTFCCCWIPFVCDDCKQDQIRCVNCHSKKVSLT